MSIDCECDDENNYNLLLHCNRSSVAGFRLNLMQID